MTDGVFELQKVSQALGQAYNAWQASSFSKYFAAKQIDSLSPEQRQMRLQLLRMMGQLIDTEFSQRMDDLTHAWLLYKESQNA